jgi:DNA-binding CsgD family transcriptional regulator
VFPDHRRRCQWAKEETLIGKEFPGRVLRFPDRAGLPAGPPGADLSGHALDVYHALADAGDLTVAELSATLHVPAEHLRSAIAELEGLRLVRATAEGTFIAIPHGQAIDDLLAQQFHLLARALDQLSEGRRRLQKVVENRSSLDPEEASRITATALGGSGETGMLDLSRQAGRTISALHPGGSFDEDLLHRSLVRAVENLQHGVRMRVVHQMSALGHPHVVVYLKELAGVGCRVRLRENLPFRLLLLDEALGICAVPEAGSFLLKGDRAISLLARVFETTWVDAVPLETVLSGGRSRASENGATRTGTPAGGLGSAHHAILRLLAEGQTDQAIAHAMGITPRTITRRVNEIYEALGVESRFQAGVAAKELGIL